jgi:hypothetical protein
LLVILFVVDHGRNEASSATIRDCEHGRLNCPQLTGSRAILLPYSPLSNWPRFSGAFCSSTIFHGRPDRAIAARTTSESKITGLARSTINRGRADLGAEPLPNGQVRRAGGGRRAVCENDPGLLPALQRLVEPATLGDPMRPLIWVSKSMEKLAAALTEMGHPISADTGKRGKSRGCQAVAHRCLTIAGKYGTSG